MASGWPSNLLLPRWAPEQDSVAEICTRLEALRLTNNDVLVLDLFSNSTYMGTDSEGYPAKPYRGDDGVFHVEGQLGTATLALLRRVWTASLPVLAAAKEATMVFCLPLPRYVNGPCCADPGHIENASDNDFDTILREGQAATRRVLDQELAKLTNKTAIYDPLSAFKAAPSLSETVSAGGVSIWSSDPVHLSRAAYHDVLTSLQAAIDGLASTPAGRSRIQSIIPVTAQPRLQLPAVPPTPSWILGELPSRGATRGGQPTRGTQRGRGGRARWQARGGRWRPY